MRVSIVVEWANTRLNGIPRAWVLLETIERQWQQLLARQYPADLPLEVRHFLDQIERRGQLVVVSGEPANDGFREELERRAPREFDVDLICEEGLEYYPLKNVGAAAADGDLLMFVDSDVLPDDNWLLHLLGTFANPDIKVAYGQTYIAPDSTYSRAFALGWTYELRDQPGRLDQHRKLYANNIVFRRQVFQQCGFPPLGRRSRGACSIIRERLRQQGIVVWQNSQATVAHPPPSGFRHLVVRALAHGRDHYMKNSQQRHVAGIVRSVGVAAGRFARGCSRAVREGRQVGLRVAEVPSVLAILGGYYGFFAMGGVLTHLSPSAMSSRFRV